MTLGIDGLIEEGQAFDKLREAPQRKRVGVLVVGAGQAGLSVGYHLKKLGLEFIVIDAHEERRRADRRARPAVLSKR